MKISKQTTTILALFALFIASRAVTLQRAGSLWFDEAFTARIAELPWSQAQAMLAYEHNPWLSFLLARVAVAFGQQDWLLRLPSVIIGGIGFWILYFFARKQWGARSGLMVCLLYTASSLLLYHQTEARMYALVVTLFAAAAFGGWQWYLQPSRRELAISGLVSLALIHTHLTAWPPVLIWVVLIAFQAHKDGKSVHEWAIVHAIALTTGMVWFIPVAIRRLSLGSVSQGWFFAQNSDGFFGMHLTNLLLNGEPRLLLRVLAAALLCALVAASAIRIEWPLRLDANRFERVLLLWLAGISLGGLALQMTVTKYVIAAIIPLILLAGRGLAKLPTRLGFAVASLMVLMVLPMHTSLLHKRHHFDEAAQQVVALQSRYRNQVTLVHTFAAALPLRRYLPEENTVTPFYPLDDQTSFDGAISRYNWLPIVNKDNVSKLDNLTHGHTVIILVSTTVDSAENDPVKARLWQQGWKLLERYTYDGYGDPEIVVFRR